MTDENNTIEQQIESSESDQGVEQENNPQESKFDMSNLDPAVQGYIKSLRKEAAGYRTNANQLKTQFEDLQGRLKSVFGGEEEQFDPGEALQTLSGQAQELQFKNAILEMAVNNAIPSTGIPYFEFLLNQATSQLEEGEELEDEEVQQLILEAKQKSGQQMMQSSVSGPSANPSQKQGITVEQFAKMGMNDRTALYRKNPEMYSELMSSWKKTIR